MRSKIKNWTVFLVVAISIGFVAHQLLLNRAVINHREMMANRFADQFVRYDQEAIANDHDFVALNNGDLTATLNAIAQGIVIDVEGQEKQIGYFSELTPDDLNSLRTRIAIENGRLALRNSEKR